MKRKRTCFQTLPPPPYNTTLLSRQTKTNKQADIFSIPTVPCLRNYLVKLLLLRQV